MIYVIINEEGYAFCSSLHYQKPTLHDVVMQYSLDDAIAVSDRHAQWAADVLHAHGRSYYVIPLAYFLEVDTAFLNSLFHPIREEVPVVHKATAHCRA